MKWLGGLMKILISSVLMAMVCVAATFFTVNAYVNLLMDQFHIQRASSQIIDWSQFMSYVGQQWEGNTRRPAPTLADAVAPNVKTDAPASEPQTQASDTSTEERSNASSPPEEEAVAVWSQRSPTEKNDHDRVVISSEDFTKKKSELTEEQKTKIFSVIAKLPEEGIGKISLWMEDGLTEQELAQISQLMQTYLALEEYEQLLSIIKPE